MILHQVKLKLTPRQERQLNHWLYHLTSVWNWAIKKIEHDSTDAIFLSEFDLLFLVKGHSKKLGIPAIVLRGTIKTAYSSWQMCFKKISRKPRLKGYRNRLNSIAFSHCSYPPLGNKIKIEGLGGVKFHKQEIPEGHIGQMRIVKRASGWYLCLFIQTEPKSIPATASGRIGIDPGFKSLLALSNGEKIPHPRELEASALRLAQAQRGDNQRLAGLIQERIANQRKDRNHKIARRLVSENVFIAFSKDNIKSIASKFGKSVQSSGHHQIRSMLAYKIKRRTDGLGVYVEPDSRNSTRTCSTCGALTGPQGWAGLSVRQWDCGACGAHHDRDTNSGINALIAGAGLAHETLVTAA